MKKHSFILLLICLMLMHCIFPESRKKAEEEVKIADSMALLIAEGMNQATGESNEENRLDYSQLEISKDSLDLKLYELLESPGNMAESLLIKNIENLVQRGANPNAMVEITYSVRKTGTYIPIIKHFYRDKYNEYTTVTSPMHAAVAYGNVPVVEKLISLGGKVDLINQDKVYLIDIALKLENQKMMDCLIANGCKVANANLSLSSNIGVIEKMVKLGANPKTIDINFALDNRTELKRVLALKPDLSKIELDMDLVMKDNELLNLLLSSGMPVTVKGTFPDQCPILFSAIKYGNMEAFKTLIQRGASVKETCNLGFGGSPLQTAIYYQQIEMLKHLLDLKVSPNEKDWTGKSALIFACGTENDQIINLLIDRGADLEYTGYFGSTPLMFAVQYQHYIAAETLIERKANVNFKSKYGETPLVKAIENNDYPMIKLLVENKANPKIIYQGKDLAAYAQEKDAAPAIVQYLKNLIEKK